jgi:hypothetical protein
MSDVYWVDLKESSFDNSVTQKLHRLVGESGAAAELLEGMRVALKVNTSEVGYEYGLRPVFLRSVVERARTASGTRPTVCDGVRLVDYWRRARGNTFMDVAHGKGYSTDTLGGNFVTNGGFSGDECNLYPFDSQDSLLGGVLVGTAVCRSDALWVLSHVTLHPLFGLSGALLNGGYECLSGRERTRVLNGLNPYPFNGNRPQAAELLDFQRGALESHLGVRAAMEDRVFYVNYLWDVTPQPEYFPYSEAPLVPNLGFLASRDPVALDAACFDLVLEHRRSGGAGDAVADRTGIDFRRILEMSETLGLGNSRPEVRRFS